MSLPPSWLARLKTLRSLVYRALKARADRL
jgi:hypothetical protein